MSIRLKLTIMFLAIATLPLLLVSVLTFRNYKDGLEANRFSQLQDLTIFRADRIEAYFAGLKSHIEIAQGFYNIKKNLPVLTRLADDPGNQEFIDAQKMLDAQLQQMQSVSDLSDIMLVNPQGRVVYANRPGHFLKDMSNGADAEKKAFAEGKSGIHFSDVYFDKVEDNRFEILLTAPASDFNGAFIGVIAFEVDMTPVYKLIQDVNGLGNTGEVLVSKKIGNQAEFLNPLRHDPNAALNRRVTFGDASARPTQEAVQGRTGSGVSTDYRGKQVIAAWRYIPSLDWGLVAKIDTKEAFADVTNLRNLAIALLFIIIVLSGITAFSIAHSISEPIKRLSEGAAIIGSGNLDYKIGNNLEDEVGQLSRSFDKMTLDLKQTTASRDELNREIIERKKSEEALRESEQRLRLAITATELGSWDYNPVTGALNWDAKCKELFGLGPQAEVDYDTFLAGLHTEDRQNVHQTVQRTFDPVSGGFFNIEYRTVGLQDGGKTRWIHATGRAFFNDAGQASRFIGTVQDITERKQMEDTLARQRKEQQVILESVPAMIFYKDKENHFVRTNKAFEDAMGRPKEKLEGQSLFDIYPKETAEAYWNDDKEVMTTHKAKYGIVEQMQTPQGTKILQTDKVPYFDEWGNVLGVIGFAVDITERKRAEDALRESEQHLSAVFSASPTGIFVTRQADGLFLEANKAYMQIIGYSSDEVIGHTSPELNIWVNPEDRKRIVGILREQGRIENSEVKFRRKNGEILDLLYSALPLERGGEHCILGTLTDITSRKRAEKLLRQSEERYRTLFETMLEGFCIIEVVFDAANKPVDYRFIDINPAFERQTGLHNAKGKLMRELAPAHEKHWFEIYGKVALTGEPARFENEARALNRWFDVSAVRVGGPESRKVAILFNDISIRKQTEEALKKSRDELEIRVKERTADLDETVSELQKQVEQRIRAEEASRSASLYARGLLEASLDPLVTISPEGKITDVNKATEAVTGISRELLIGSDFSNYFTEPGKARDGYKKVLSEGMVIDYPLTIRHTSGHTTDVLYNATVYKNPAGEIQGVFAAARDVTVQKQASQYARSLIESSLDPLVTISADGKITDVNEATIKVTGISRQQLIGTDFSDYFIEPQKASEGYKKVFDEGFVTDYPLTIRHRDGRLTDVLYNATVYKDTHGNVIGVFAAARDITEKKAAEAELEKYRLHLEDLVKNRTEELSRSNKDLEQFAYVASHDLQEPLRAVSGFVELLRRNLEKSLDEKTNEYINFSIDGAKRMQSLINGLLEYSRVGTQGKEPQPVNSKAAFDEALARLQASIKETGAEITADDLPEVYFDDVLLSQLFQNLIGNAIKFRSDQAPQIHVSAVHQDAGWRFAVRDNGIGIEPQYTERIFMIFQRLHTRKTYPGTGIGLSICKKIVERHGGKIWVESTPERGSTFYFTVPDIEGA